MLDGDVGLAAEVGNGAGDLEDAVVGAGGVPAESRLRDNLTAKPKLGNSSYQWMRIRGQVRRPSYVHRANRNATPALRGS